MNTQIGRGSIAVLAVGLLLVGGCARSPEAKKARALERGERYFQKEQYREAIVEYLNAFRIDQTEARAIQRIGLAHYRLGEVAQAVRFLLRAEQLTPDDLEVRLALGTIYLRASRPEEAGQEAAFILSKDPRNLDALVLLAGAADTPDEIASTIQRLEGLRADLGGQARFHVALANLYLRSGICPARSGPCGKRSPRTRSRPRLTWPSGTSSP
jgi:tetratricopeptide (TPR) repeat protein